MNFIGLISSITSISTVIFLFKKKYVKMSEIGWSFVFAGIVVILAQLISTIISALHGNIHSLYLYSVLTLLEEAATCLFYLLAFKEHKNIYNIILFGLAFAIIENVLLTPSDPSRIIMGNIVFFTHSAFMLIFYYLSIKIKNRKYNIFVAILAASTAHLIFNLAVYFGSNLLYYCWLAFLMEISWDIIRKKSINKDHLEEIS